LKSFYFKPTGAFINFLPGAYETSIYLFDILFFSQYNHMRKNA